MYNLRHSEPRLAGYLYRRNVRCGKPNCRCALSEKRRHTAYYLQYVDETGKRRNEYVPKSKVRALRARIKRAKTRDTEIRVMVKQFVKLTPPYVKWLKGSLSTKALAQRCQLPQPDTLHEDSLSLLLEQALILSVQHLSRRRIQKHLPFLTCIQVASCLIDLFLALQQMSESARFSPPKPPPKAPRIRPNLRLT